MNRRELKDLLKDSSLLFVDDEEAIRESFADMFPSFFKEVEIASDGVEALEIYKQREFDLVISDIRMPNMDGIELTQHIKEINPKQPVIIISAHSESEYFMELIESGIDGFILKPIKPKLLFEKISQILSSSIYEKRYNEQRDKLATVGEMMENITHQWKQPLNALNLRFDKLRIEFESGVLSQDIFDSDVKKIQKYIYQIAQTIDDFKGFFSPTVRKDKFCVDNTIESILNIIGPILYKNEIEIVKDIERIEVYTSEGALKHIILNLLSNAKDALIDSKRDDKKIEIYLKELDDSLELSIKDNAGGVPDDIIDQIFKSHFTTKDKSTTEGSGVGLYMSKQLAKDKLEATIDVENIENEHGKGACFKLLLPKSSKY
jgi:YesN/AraC family two-component response regulator